MTTYHRGRESSLQRLDEDILVAAKCVPKVRASIIVEYQFVICANATARLLCGRILGGVNFHRERALGSPILRISTITDPSFLDSLFHFRTKVLVIKPKRIEVQFGAMTSELFCKVKSELRRSRCSITGRSLLLILSLFLSSLCFSQTTPVTSLPPPAQRFALLIGVGTYSHGITPLNGPTHDVIALKKALVDFAGFDEKNVLTLSSESKNAEDLPTKDNIIVQLNSLKGRLAGGLLLVAFSGHGFYKFHTPFLLTYEAVDGDINDLTQTSLPVSSLQKKLQTINAKQIILLLDACQNDPESSKGNAGDNLMVREFAEAFENLVIQPNQASAVLYATRPPERAYINASNLGYFTEAVTEALSGKAHRSTGKPPVSLAELTSYIETEVPSRVEQAKQKKQEPDHRFIRYAGSTVLVDSSWIDSPFASGTAHRVHFQHIGATNDCASLPSNVRLRITLAQRAAIFYAPPGCDLDFLVPTDQQTGSARIELLDATDIELGPKATFDTSELSWNVDIVSKGPAVRISGFDLVDAPGSPDFYQIVQQRLGSIASKVSVFPDLRYSEKLELVRTGRRSTGSLMQQSAYAKATNSLELISGQASIDPRGQNILHLAFLIPRAGGGVPFTADVDVPLNDYPTLQAVSGSTLLFALLQDAIRTMKPIETIAHLREETLFELKQIDPLPPSLSLLLNEVMTGR